MAIVRMAAYTYVFNSNDEEEKRKLSRSIFEIKQGFKNCVVKLFEIIVNEYNSCNKPKISKDDFVLKLEEFSKNTDYQHFYMLDDSIVNMTKEINKIIKRFSKGRSKQLIENIAPKEEFNIQIEVDKNLIEGIDSYIKKGIIKAVDYCIQLSCNKGKKMIK